MKHERDHMISADLTRILEVYAKLWPGSPINDEKAGVWQAALGRYEPDRVIEAIRDYAAGNIDHRPPTPAKIRRAVTNAAGRLDTATAPMADDGGWPAQIRRMPLFCQPNNPKEPLPEVVAMSDDEVEQRYWGWCVGQAQEQHPEGSPVIAYYKLHRDRAAARQQ